jgi:hypothetical protein
MNAWVSIINIDENGIKEPTSGYQSNVYVEWVCQSERIVLYPSYWLGQILMNHIDTRAIMSRCEDNLAWYIDPNGIKRKNVVKNHILLVENIVKSYYRYFNGIEKNDTMPT